MTGSSMSGAAKTPDLHLASATPASWAEAVAHDVPALLSDHAHLELKAAASGMTLLKRHPRFARRLAPLIREEADHLQRVLRELEQRGAALQPDSPSPYAAGLLAAAGAPRRRADGLLDSLLVSALIEQRSQERFERLMRCESLSELRPLYRTLAEAEERHGVLFLELAAEVAPPATVAIRWRVLAEAEARLIAGLPFAVRIHSGPPR
jgi:tRNA-(ms[2]io[6]A)-hydroxylase